MEAKTALDRLRDYEYFVREGEEVYLDVELLLYLRSLIRKEFNEKVIVNRTGYRCPECKTWVGWDEKIPNRCPECGQKIYLREYE